MKIPLSPNVYKCIPLHPTSEWRKKDRGLKSIEDNVYLRARARCSWNLNSKLIFLDSFRLFKETPLGCTSKVILEDHATMPIRDPVFVGIFRTVQYRPWRHPQNPSCFLLKEGTISNTHNFTLQSYNKLSFRAKVSYFFYTTSKVLLEVSCPTLEFFRTSQKLAMSHCRTAPSSELVHKWAFRLS